MRQLWQRLLDRIGIARSDLVAEDHETVLSIHYQEIGRIAEAIRLLATEADAATARKVMAQLRPILERE